MTKENLYSLPKLLYEPDALEPYLSEEQLKIHYEKHHASYVLEANKLLREFDKIKTEKYDFDIKSFAKNFSFQVGGHILHSLFWENIGVFSNKDNKIFGKINASVNKEFGGFNIFKNEFTKLALSVEGSGWAALVQCNLTGRLLLMQIEKHNVNIYPQFKILMLLDMFEHAYYIDYKNNKTKYVEAFWHIVDWEAVSMRLN